MSSIDEIDKKFDKAEKFVERGGKLILKIVTGVVGIALAVVFAWGQVHDTLDDHGIHVHSEDAEFQEYLMDMETSAGYYEGEIDSLYEDSLYADYYRLALDTVGVNDTDVVYIEEEWEEDSVELDTVMIDLSDTIVPEIDNMDMPDLVDTISVDTIN